MVALLTQDGIATPAYSWLVLAPCQIRRMRVSANRSLAHQAADQVSDESADERPGEIGRDRPRGRGRRVAHRVRARLAPGHRGGRDRRRRAHHRAAGALRRLAPDARREPLALADFLATLFLDLLGRRGSIGGLPSQNFLATLAIDARVVL